MPKVSLRFSEPRNSGYSIQIQPGLLGQAGQLLKKLAPGRSPFIISSPRVYALWGRKLEASLRKAGFKDLARHLVPDGERNKHLGSYTQALKALADFGQGQRRRPIVLLLGGGVIGDLGGFVAATYKRGLPFVQMPTTLLSMVDSSVGGKLGVDLKTARGVIKNLVGTFAQPQSVWIDPAMLSTLAHREIRAGMAEAVKTAALFDPRLFSAIEKNPTAYLTAQPAVITQLIQRCVGHKARVVARDEFDRHGLRTLLNLGHTFGHAVEAASGFKLLHGECVAFGMACAVDLAFALEKPSHAKRAELRRIEALLIRLGLPTRLKGLSLVKILKTMSEDKKFEAGMIFIVPKGLGKAQAQPVKNLALIREILRKRLA